MEIIKSVLKKSDALDPNKERRVSFSNTVRVFIDDRNSNPLIDNVKPSPLNWIEINIVDKSTDLGVEAEPLTDENSEANFLVHKVIYDNYILPENDDDLDIHNKSDEEENVVLFESEADEGLEFVVHKVTDHEDDLIKKDSDFHQENENISTEDDTGIENKNEVLIKTKNENISVTEKSQETVMKFSKLSIENILQHDKIIAFIDQRNMGLTPLPNNVDVQSNNKTTVKKSSDGLVLSPPLQELSLEKIVKAHSDNILCELDISPLNSVQETDSDSDASSEGTMIMMTTEESQKNEQHIRESLMQYQSIKEKVNQAKTKPGENNSSKSPSIEQPNVTNTRDVLECQSEKVSESNVSDVKTSIPNLVSERFPETLPGGSGDESLNVNLCDGQLFTKSYSSSSPNSTVTDQNYLQSNQTQRPKHTPQKDKHFKQNFSSVEIPCDVREWKILIDSQQISNTDKTTNMLSNSKHSSEKEYLSSNSTCFYDISPQKSDELENFVHESTERVERIRQRYHMKQKQHTRHTHSMHSPVRGVRPRFGSTAEILDMMQKQTNPPFMNFNGTKNHMSWPCEEASSVSNVERTMSNYQPPFYFSQGYSSECSSQSSINSYCEEDRLNTSCDHCSISSCPSVMVHEKNLTDGRMSAEIDNSFDSTNSDSYVYFSMKV